MKAIVQDRYGSPDVLELREIDKPVVEDDEVLVRVRATSVHPDIWHVVAGRPYIIRLMGLGVLKPKSGVPGTDVAGLVESVGKNVTQFQPGDEVFGEIVGGIQWKHGGAYAEYVSVPEDELALKPTNLTFEQAAAVPTSGLIALRNLRDGGPVRSGQRVLINGAGGNVGSFAVQIAKAYGAEVTGVDCTEKMELMRSTGADQVIDYTQEDFTSGSKRYDIILDVASNLSLSDCRRVLTPDGTYVLIGHDHFGNARGPWLGSMPRFFGQLALSPFVSYLPSLNFSKSKSLMATLKEFMEAGKMTPVIDKTFPLSEAAGALRYLQDGHARGRVVITP